jgi:hypothetical protein
VPESFPSSRADTLAVVHRPIIVRKTLASVPGHWCLDDFEGGKGNPIPSVRSDQSERVLKDPALELTSLDRIGRLHVREKDRQLKKAQLRHLAASVETQGERRKKYIEQRDHGRPPE